MSAASDLSDRRVLVVEDEYFIADEIESALRRRRATVVGPAPTLEEARVLFDREQPDCAVLDINLAGEMVFAFADELRERTVPFVFATGYDAPVVPSRFADVDRVEKPLNINKLMEALARTCRRGVA